MKDKSLNCTCDTWHRASENHQTQISPSIVCFLLESNKNYTFNRKSHSLWSIQVDFDLKQIKMLWRIKAWIVPATLDIAPLKITKHKSHLESSVFCLNEIKITHSTENHILYGQSRWILIWSTNKNVMKDKSLNCTCDTWHRASENHKTQISPSIVWFFFLLESNKNYTFNRKSHSLWSIQVDFDLKNK